MTMKGMKELFPEYCPTSEDDIKKIWNSCLFVFDANVLLNMYRYEKKTVAQFFEICSKISDRIWMPYQVCKEFMRNRPGVTMEQADAIDHYVAFAERLSKNITDEFDKLKFKMHSSINIEQIVGDIQQKIKDVNSELADARTGICGSAHDRLANDEILDKIELLYKGKINTEPTDIDTQAKLINERYKNNIPPGYQDVKEKGPENAHGDCLIWFEILSKAQTDPTHIIFISDDKKEDWVWKIHGKQLWCRPELRHEFSVKSSGKSFVMYNMVRFLEFADKYISVEVEQSSITDARRVATMTQPRLPMSNFFRLFRSHIMALLSDSISKVDTAKLNTIFHNLSNNIRPTDFLNPPNVMSKLHKIFEIVREYEANGLIREGSTDDAVDIAFKMLVRQRKMAAHAYSESPFGDDD